MADEAPRGVRDAVNVCSLCGTLQNLSLCAGCRSTWYCCKGHQIEDWKKHKHHCRNKQSKGVKGSPAEKIVEHQIDKSEERALRQLGERFSLAFSHPNRGDEGGGASDDSSLTPFTGEGSSEAYVLGSEANELVPATEARSNIMPPHGDRPVLAANNYFAVLTARFEHLSQYVRDCLEKYGICVFDNFLGPSKAKEIHAEVMTLQKRGEFKQGQLVNTASGVTQQTIRGDVITWVDGSEPECSKIHFLMSCMDDLIKRCAGGLQSYTITERTKAMVACYPANSRGYLRHVDNPNRDGRCITCIYYLNEKWNADKDGGLLRIFPEGQETVATIEPLLDRLLFFWSDRRNPHEVMPTSKSRYAITVWYYDGDERKKAVKRFRGSNNNSSSQKRSAVPLINGDAKQ